MSELKNQTIARIAAAIESRRRFLVATHIRPDGDAIGSLLGLTAMLRRLGKEATPFSQDPVPSTYTFLAGSEKIRLDAPLPSDYDAAILVDCGDFPRIGPTMEAPVARIPFLINIDHHVSKAPFGDICWVEESASSTCEMLFDLGQALPLTIDSEIATNLYTGLLTDTGSFRFSNTSLKVLETAARLVAAGANPSRIAQMVFDSSSSQGLRLLGRVLSTVSFHAGERLAAAELTMRMLEETGSSHSDSESFINHLRSVKPVEVAMMFREGDDGLVHVSMRSKGKIDVAGFARRYGGGGHRQAAACRLPGNIESIRSRLVDEALSDLI